MLMIGSIDLEAFVFMFNGKNGRFLKLRSNCGDVFCIFLVADVLLLLM